MMENELYHHGIIGQKWGIRRFQNKDGTHTSAGKKRYRPTKIDKDMWGERGAQRIADRRNKGDSRNKAVAKEALGQVGTIMGIYAVGSLAMYTVFSGKYKDVIDSGKQAAKIVADAPFNAKVIDANGDVIHRYRTTVKTGEEVVNSLLRLK